MRSHDPQPAPIDAENHRDRRLRLLIGRLPGRMQNFVHWLREPSRRWVRLPAGLFFLLGGCLAILPVFGLWMLPLGVALIAEDVPPLRRWTASQLEWIEHKRPHWMGLPQGGAQGGAQEGASQ